MEIFFRMYFNLWETFQYFNDIDERAESDEATRSDLVEFSAACFHLCIDEDLRKEKFLSSSPYISIQMAEGSSKANNQMIEGQREVTDLVRQLVESFVGINCGKKKQLDLQFCLIKKSWIK